MMKKYIINFFNRFDTKLMYANNIFVGNKFDYWLAFFVFFALFCFYFFFGGDLGFYIGFFVSFWVYFFSSYIFKEKEGDNWFVIFIKYYLFRGIIVIGLIVFIFFF